MWTDCVLFCFFYVYLLWFIVSVYCECVCTFLWFLVNIIEVIKGKKNKIHYPYPYPSVLWVTVGCRGPLVCCCVFFMVCCVCLCVCAFFLWFIVCVFFVVYCKYYWNKYGKGKKRKIPYPYTFPHPSSLWVDVGCCGPLVYCFFYRAPDQRFCLSFCFKILPRGIFFDVVSVWRRSSVG